MRTTPTNPTMPVGRALTTSLMRAVLRDADGVQALLSRDLCQ